MRTAHLLIAATTTLAAQAQFPAARGLEVREGEGRPEVTVLAEDGDGLLWTGSATGVVRTDGVRHQLVLRTMGVRVTAMASGGRLMFVGLASGVVLQCSPMGCDTLDAVMDQFGTAITALTVDEDGRLWVGTHDKGLRVWDGKAVQVLDATHGLQDDHVNAMCMIEGYGVMVATDQGVVLFGSDTRSAASFDASNGLPDNLVLALCSGEEGEVWAGTHGKGPVRISIKENIIGALDGTWAHGPVRSLAYSAGLLWVGTNAAGTVVCGTDPGMGWYTEPVLERPPPVARVITAGDGAVWWCNGSDVIVRADPGSLIIPRHEGLDLRKVTAVCGDDGGRIWLVTPDGVHGHATEFSEGERLQQVITGKLDVPFTSIAADAFGTLWLGTLGRGLVRVPANAPAQRISLDPGDAGDNVMALRIREGELWMATLSGLAMIPLHQAEARAVRRFPLPGSGFVYDVLPMSDGSVLAATDGNGLMRLRADGSVVPLEPRGSRTFYSLCTDRNGTAWACGPGTGLCRVLGDSVVATQVGAVPFDGEVFGIAPANAGVLVVAAAGVFVYDAERDRTQRVDGSLPQGRISAALNAVHAFPDGSYWFATDRGLVHLHPSARPATNVVPTLITAVMVAGEAVPVDKALRMDHTRNILRIEFSGLHFAAPEHVLFEYQLLGHEPMVHVGRDREVVYSRLEPGSYTFQVRAFVEGDRPEGPWTTLAIRIDPPWWRTGLAIGGISLLAAILAYLLIRARDRRMRAREAMEKERMRFQLDALRSQVNPHFLFNSFGTLMELIEQDKTRATAHVEGLSAFFREILQVRDKDLIPLEEELRLLDIYFKLEKERFGQRVGLTLRIDAAAYAMFLPPLTLQLLVENALKHNAATDAAPLHVEVVSEGDDLLVRNPIQARRTKPASSGFGLESIQRRYQALTVRPVHVTTTDGTFVVRVPLLHAQP